MASIRFSWYGALGRLIVLSRLRSELFVLHENRLDRINGAGVSPFIAIFDLRHPMLKTVVAFKAQVFHQHRFAILEPYYFRVATHGLCQQPSCKKVAILPDVVVTHGCGPIAPRI